MKVRVAKWDNLKFFLIFCVVAGHFLARIEDLPNAQRVIFLIYSFHMPAFMFLSGLMSNRTVEQKCYDKIFGYLVAFLMIKLVLLSLRVVYSHDTTLDVLKMNDISWYAFVLFVYYMATIFLGQFHPAWTLTFSVILACLIGYAPAFNTWLSASRLFTFYPFFLAGYYTDPGKLLAFTGRKPVKIASGVCMTAAAVFIVLKIERINWLLKILKGKWAYESLEKMNTQGAFLRLGWYAAAGVLVIALIALMPSVHSFITTLGSRTLAVYILHYIPMNLFFKTFHGKEWVLRVGHSTLLVLLASLAATLILSIKPITLAINKCISPPKWK